MILEELRVAHVRNIQGTKIHLNPGKNIITGPNGSGKTSLLESLYILGCGHSFRSRELSAVMTHGQRDLTVFGRSSDDETLSIQKSIDKPTMVQWNQQRCYANSDLAYRLPIQVFHQGLFEIINAGPSVRRSLLDWGMFHVKHDYLPLMKDYKKILKHRNALLRQREKASSFDIWNHQLSSLAEKVHTMRADYIREWMTCFDKLCPKLIDFDCQITYEKGWDKKEKGFTLKDVLEHQFDTDMQRQYTQSGAHQADLIIKAIDKKAKQVLSRGQQKMILTALKLSQVEILNKPCLLLLDDFPAELDDDHQRRLWEYLKNSTQQCVITATQPLQADFRELMRDYDAFAMSSGEVHKIGESACFT